MPLNGRPNIAPVMPSVFLPGFRLLDVRTDVECEQRRKPAQEEHRPPPKVGVHAVVSKRSKQVAHGVAFLKESRQHAPPLCRDGFHRERGANPPFSAHADAKQCSKDEERREVGREPAEHFYDRIKQHINHQRKLSAVAVGHQPEQKGPHWPEGERDAERQGDGGIALLKILRNLREHHDDNEEIEGIERPA